MLEPQFVQVAKSYAGNPEIAFYAVNTDEDRSLVAPFLNHEKWDVPVVYADGLDDFMKVDSLPTVLLLDPAGKITYRINGYPPEGFTENLTNAIQSSGRFHSVDCCALKPTRVRRSRAVGAAKLSPARKRWENSQKKRSAVGATHLLTGIACSPRSSHQSQPYFLPAASRAARIVPT